MKYATDVIFSFTPRVLVDTVDHKTFDHRLPDTCLKEIHERGHILEVLNDIQSHSRKRDRTTEDGTFLLHKKGDITSTFTGDWLLTEGESRDRLGEWLK
jgi:hypothetical protein